MSMVTKFEPMCPICMDFIVTMPKALSKGTAWELEGDRDTEGSIIFYFGPAFVTRGKQC